MGHAKTLGRALDVDPTTVTKGLEGSFVERLAEHSHELHQADFA